MINIKITRFEFANKIDDDQFVRFTEMGNITEIFHNTCRSKGGHICKLDKNSYVDLTTGEVKEFQHIENRSEDLANVAKSLKRGRDLLNANITDVSKCRWLTLTYAENMTDTKKLKDDFKNFNTRCRQLFGNYEYITAAEPQGRGAWHLHVVLIFDHKAPFMDSDIVSDCWKQGFVKVKRLDEVDNVGAYLTAYLGDMDLDEYQDNDIKIGRCQIKSVDFTDEDGNKQTKKYIKGARLYMYPPGFHIFRFSKGIKEPIVSIVPYEKAKEKVNSAKLTFSKSVSLEDNENDFESVLTYEYYNRLRK